MFAAQRALPRPRPSRPSTAQLTPALGLFFCRGGVSVIAATEWRPRCHCRVRSQNYAMTFTGPEATGLGADTLRCTKAATHFSRRGLGDTGSIESITVKAIDSSLRDIRECRTEERSEPSMFSAASVCRTLLIRPLFRYRAATSALHLLRKCQLLRMTLHASVI